MKKKKKRIYSFNSDASIDKDWDDSRYIKMRLRILNEGVNPNNTNFGATAIEDAKLSLSNTPILANILVDEEAGEIDAGSHDYKIVKDPINGGYRKIYKELVIGIIPETHDYVIEEYNGKQYVYADAYIFRGYANYGEDFIEQNDEVSISMEIEASEVDESDSKIVDIVSYKYLGVTILGNTLSTGIEDARGFKFDTEENKSDFVNKCKELKYILEGEVKVKKKKFDQVPEPDAKKTEKYQLIYELSHDDVRGKVYQELYDASDYWPWLIAVYDDYCVYDLDGTVYKRSYSMDNNDVSLKDDIKKVSMQFLTDEEILALDVLKVANTDMFEEVEKLRAYKVEKETEKEDGIKADFKQEKIDFIKNDFDYLEEDQVKIFITDIDEYKSIEDLEMALCVYVVKHKVKTFSKTKTKEEVIKTVKPVAVFEKDNKNTGYYGDLSPNKK